MPVRLCRLVPSAVQMPALSWPRCCRANNEKKASRATSSCAEYSAVTPHSSRGLSALTASPSYVRLPERLQVSDLLVEHAVDAQPRPSSIAHRGGRHSVRRSQLDDGRFVGRRAGDYGSSLILREQRHVRL